MSKGKIEGGRKVPCGICGIEFITFHSMGKYCSQDCRRKGWRSHWNAYGARNRDYRKAYQYQYYDKNTDKVMEKTSKYIVTERGKEVRKKAAINQRKTMDPKIRSARNSVRCAMLRGDLVQKPCEVCDTLPTEAHHDDYSKPLDVRWLCKKHHAEHHRALKRAKVPEGALSREGHVRINSRAKKDSV